MVAPVVARRLPACQPPRQPHVPRVRAVSSSVMRSALAAVAVVLVLGLGACGSSNKGPATIDASSDAAGGCTAGGTAAGMLGETCGCDRDCQSGFCVDGVCCNTACTGTCMACNVQGSPGNLRDRSRGRRAADADRLPGVGRVQLRAGRHLRRQRRLPPARRGNGVQGGRVFGRVRGRRQRVRRASGHCKPGPATICAPFNCDPATRACIGTCRSNADCVPGVLCVNGSCGPKPPGAVCTQGRRLRLRASAPTGSAATSAAAARASAATRRAGSGRAGRSIPARDDPHGMCRDKGPASCGQTGACDGVGGCSLYARRDDLRRAVVQR